jgi:hypothetical protein
VPVERIDLSQLTARIGLITMQKSECVMTFSGKRVNPRDPDLCEPQGSGQFAPVRQRFIKMKTGIQEHHLGRRVDQRQ